MWDESMATDSCDTCNNCSSRTKKQPFRMDDDDDACMDKENLPQSPMKTEDISLYGSVSPPPLACMGTSPNHCKHLKTRRPLEDFDLNSQDSGYAASYETFGKFTSTSFSSNSMCSMDEEFLEDFAEVESIDEHVSQDLAKLINGPKMPIRNIFQQKENQNFASPVIRPVFRRAMSLQFDGDTPPNANRARCLFSDARSKFKRPETPTEEDSPTTKKYKRLQQRSPLNGLDSLRNVPLFQRSMSATEESIKFALQRSSTEPDLIGDFSKTFCLPLVLGRHQDLKSISANTLVQLIKGAFTPYVDSFTVVDCRYPYEFEGGHIENAINIFTREQCLELLNEKNVPTRDASKRHILVFHCEFSSERGPNLCRFLRKEDRQKNEDAYPSLHYPEIYLLEGGYKNFYENHRELCVPESYKPMNHPEHEQDLRKFRQRSKTWNMDVRMRPTNKGGQYRRLL